MAEEKNLFAARKGSQESGLGFTFPGGSFAFILFLILILLFFGDN
ncbi:hypothetical protein [Neomoorella thermoacetica]|uniref:Uncharacterized protein n=1 Tax=Neomoorella thermoacetica TaxID=1525 RepID=A0A1J5K5F1_NEOTH|nr:hypothetical protein [Moorella thermoacetica]AKX94372.1 hypothetical protein MOTHE_c15790 [Moorella thermoacetica]AKX97010.1 hypothetical protein MOTHA_c16640 [Moorella thermoacetica]APC08787.1 hypothetical protein MTJW_16280 [Moorella thermoacetica]OIQ07901.1 hypothetical protein MOOR_24590 [Moorella thermoacetica]OIQ10945.1 hypothetical protein MOOTH_21230 [Moorella thermoacetica]